jgi:phosphonate utilization associated putative membrane protein
MMTPVGLAIGASVLMHVTWNLMVRHQPRETYSLWWVLLAHLVLLAPWGVITLFRETTWSSSFVLLLVTSAAANVTYFLGLRQAYKHAPVALVYPLVRSSPILIALWGQWFFGDYLGWQTWIGVVISVLGLIVLALTTRSDSDRMALPWAMLAMLSTSIYSLSDRAATAHIVSFGGLVGFISFGYLAAWLALTVELRFTEGIWKPRQRMPLPLMAIGGLCVGFAYVLVIHAMRSLPAAVVVTFTNAGIVLATVLSIVVFKEKAHWQRRILAASIICLGLLFLAR